MAERVWSGSGEDLNNIAILKKMEDKDFRELAMLLLYVIETSIEVGDWKVDGSNDPEILINKCKKIFGEDYPKYRKLLDEECAIEA